LIDPFEGCTKHFCIIGMPKCGQVSLENYLRDRFPGKEARRIEKIWKPKEIQDVVEKRPPEEWHYVIILRDNVERIWSSYHYFDYYKSMSLEKYLNHDIQGTRLGPMNPIKQGNYGRWLKEWSSLNPIIVTLEDMQKLPGFPHMNKTGDKRKYPEISESDRELISSYLNNEEELIYG